MKNKSLLQLSILLISFLFTCNEQSVQVVEKEYSFQYEEITIEQLQQQLSKGDLSIEALTRAYAVLNDKQKYQEHHDLTIKSIADVKDPEDKKIVQGELDKIQSP